MRVTHRLAAVLFCFGTLVLGLLADGHIQPSQIYGYTVAEQSQITAVDVDFNPFIKHSEASFQLASSSAPGGEQRGASRFHIVVLHANQFIAKHFIQLEWRFLLSGISLADLALLFPFHGFD